MPRLKGGANRHDRATDGRTYMSHIEMHNANTLRVEGCAFGGMFCGGQNWKRVL